MPAPAPAEIRAYWTEQWREIAPHVEPVAFAAAPAGATLADLHVGHRFTLAAGRIQAMELTPPPEPA